MISKDPYKILGVSPTASDAEIKSAYKELVKKYHPDQYQDNPLADVAEEKMSEINAAYDAIKNGDTGPAGPAGPQGEPPECQSFDPHHRGRSYAKIRYPRRSL